ncbi:hypothetical protein SEA_AMGINE_88 [Mycobacterium phage Amgine]|uniref:Uncharacterized protein n=1 Tax=Mycobacterium phage Amgine TaxID=2015817 RepID=A0A222ZMI3_9CAUD|nr:hypothetical protein I5G84_gp88 [Mycobacterium phage Amgine]ASR85688.1 hypothetical protein SEA_AMGINE_88 [Mycobacterium phage Amgine]
MSGEREQVDYAAVQRFWEAMGWQLAHAEQEPERARLRNLFGGKR